MTVLTALRSIRRAWSMHWDGAPWELCRAYPLLIEERMACNRPVPLVSRADAVFALPDGNLIVTETKSRSVWEIRTSDIVQMSAAATVLRHSDDPRVRNRLVRPYGYLRLVHRGTASWHRVGLLPDAAVALAWLKHWAGDRQKDAGMGKSPIWGEKQAV